MNRRSFLSVLAATLVADPERALWVPGKKLISIPKPTIVREIDFEEFCRRYVGPASIAVERHIEQQLYDLLPPQYAISEQK